MPTTVSRAAWLDQFTTPTDAMLVSGVSGEMGTALVEIREKLKAVEGVKERIDWQGVPWRWTFVYSRTQAELDPWAYLVPDPTRALIVVPLSLPMLEALPMRKLSRTIREGIARATGVGGLFWAEWELGTGTSVSDIVDLATASSVATPA